MTVEVHVVTPERELWSGEASMVVARGVEGEVGILAGHVPLLVRLDVGTLRIHQNEGAPTGVVVDGGFLHVTSEADATRVDVLASQAELASEVDSEAARTRKAQAEERLAQDGDDAEAAAELAKASARLDAAGS